MLFVDNGHVIEAGEMVMVFGDVGCVLPIPRI